MSNSEKKWGNDNKGLDNAYKSGDNAKWWLHSASERWDTASKGCDNATLGLDNASKEVRENVSEG